MKRAAPSPASDVAATAVACGLVSACACAPKKPGCVKNCACSSCGRRRDEKPPRAGAHVRTCTEISNASATAQVTGKPLSYAEAVRPRRVGGWQVCGWCFTIETTRMYTRRAALLLLVCRTALPDSSSSTDN